MLVGVGGSETEGVATGFTADLDTGDLLDAWAPVTVSDSEDLLRWSDLRYLSW